MGNFSRLPGMMVNLVIAVIFGYIAYLIISSLLGIPEWWSAIKSGFPDTYTFAIVVAFLVIAVYGTRKGAGGASIFTYTAGAILLGAFLFIFALGHDGAEKAFSKFQQTANEKVQNGINLDFGSRPETQETVGPLQLGEGNLLHLRKGESKHVHLTGKVLAPVPESGYCLNINPPEKVEVTWNIKATRIWIKPIDTSAEVVVTKHNDC